MAELRPEPEALDSQPTDPAAVPDEQQERRKAHLRAISGGGALMLLGMLLQNALRFATSVAVSRGLGQAALGDFGLLTAVERDGQVLAEAGTGRSVLKFVPAALAAEDPGGARHVAWLAVGIAGASGLLSFAALWLVAPALAEGVYRQPELTLPLQVAAAFVPFAALATTLAAVPQAERNAVPLIVVTRIGVPALFLGCAVLIGRAQGSMTDLMWASAGTMAAGAAAAGLWAWHWVRPWRGAPRKAVTARELLRFSLAVWIAGCSQLILGTADVLILRRYVPAAELGTYVAAARSGAFVVMPMGAIGSLVGPAASDLWARGDVAGLQQMYRATTRWITAAGFVLVAPLLLAPVLLLKVFGKGYDEGGAIMAAVAIGQLVNASTGNVGQVLAMVGEERALALTNGVAAAVMIAALIWVSPLHGAFGAALCVGSLFAIVNLSRVAWLWRRTGLHPYDSRYLLCSAASGLALALAAVAVWGQGTAWRVGAIGIFWLGQAALARHGWVPGSARLLEAVRSLGRRGRRQPTVE